MHANGRNCLAKIGACYPIYSLEVIAKFSNLNVLISRLIISRILKDAVYFKWVIQNVPNILVDHWIQTYNASKTP